MATLDIAQCIALITTMCITTVTVVITCMVIGTDGVFHMVLGIAELQPV